MGVNLNGLASIIELVRTNIDNTPSYDRYNEARTREALVAPVLASMGWNVADFSLVDVEYPVNRGEGQHMVDYALWAPSSPRKSREDKPFVLVESKEIDKDLTDQSILKGIRHYAFRAGVPYVILTNGKIWQTHVFPSAVVGEHHQLQEDVDIYDASITAKSAADNLKSMFESVLRAKAYSLSPGWICLKQYLSPKRDSRRHPKAIRFPDGAEKETRYWSLLVSHTAEWLYAEGLFPADDPDSLRNHRGEHLVTADEDDAYPWKMVGDAEENLFVWIGGGKRRAPDNAGILLQACGKDLEDVYLQVPR